MQAGGPEGQVKMAVTVGDTEPGPNEMAAWRGRISGYYMVMFGGAVCKTLSAVARNDALLARPTFKYDQEG